MSTAERAPVPARGRRVAFLAHHAGYLLNFRGPILREMVGRGCAVTVVSPDGDGDLKTRLEAMGIRLIPIRLDRTGLNPLADRRYRDQLRANLEEIDPAIVIATGLKPVAYGMPIAHAIGVACRAAIFTGLGAALRPTTIMQRLIGVFAKPLIRHAVRHVTHAIVQNEDDAQLLRRLAPNCQDRIVLTRGSGVDLDRFQRMPATGHDMVLMMSRIIRDKGVLEFVEAARIVRGRRPFVRFCICGFFERRAGAIPEMQFRDLCRRAGVEYLDHSSDVRSLLASCALLALPSYHEGRPRSVQEALAIGRPVVTSDAAGCRDSIVDGIHGRVVSVRDPEALATAIEEVLRWPDREGVAERCRLLAVQRYDAVQIARDLLDTLGIGLSQTIAGALP